LSFLEVLWGRFGRFVPYDGFYRPIWGLVEAELPADPDLVLRVMKCRLRDRLRAVGLKIKNSRGLGYGLFWRAKR